MKTDSNDEKVTASTVTSNTTKFVKTGGYTLG